MSHDVFISFSSANADIAEKVCGALEKSGKIKCWIAFRDIVPSANYAEQLVEAIESCKLLLLILSEESNKSTQVAREIERAGSKGIPILPLRIEDVVLSKSMEYFISSHHWLDAYESDIEDYFPALKTAVESSILGKTKKQSGTDTGTRKKIDQPPSKKIEPKYMFAVSLAVTLILVSLLIFRPENNTTVEEGTSTTIEPSAVTSEKETSPASPQDALIQELAQRFKDNKPSDKKHSDGWTSSSPLSIAFLDISGSGINDAELDFIVNQTSEELRNSGRYYIVERTIIDKLLEELNLSSSALADPSTALKLGRILSANLIVTGSLTKQNEQWLASMRFIETETTAVKCSVSSIVNEGGAPAVVTELDNAINIKLQNTYPLQAKITSISGDTAAINIGKISGVSPGMVFSLLQENNTAAGQATVTTVEPNHSSIIFSSGAAGAREGMRLREKVKE